MLPIGSIFFPLEVAPMKLDKNFKWHSIEKNSKIKLHQCVRRLKLSIFGAMTIKVSKGAKIRNQYNHVPHLTKDTNGKVTTSQLDTTNESQEVSPFP